MASTWAKMVFLTVKNVTKNHLVLSAHTVTVLLVEKYCKPVIIIIFIRPVPDAQSVEIRSAMEKKCIYKAVRYGILVAVQVHQLKLVEQF